MKRLLLIALLLSFGFSQQITHTTTYDNGNIKGITYHKETRTRIEKVKYREYDENGQKKEEVTFKDGKEDVWTSWYGNGQKMYEQTYKDGKEDGKWTGWHENGQKKSEGTLKDGEQDGLWTYWDENGQKYSEITFKNGKVPPKLSNFTPHLLFINEATCLQCHQSERTMNFGAGPVVAKKMIHEFRENCVTCHLMPK